MTAYEDLIDLDLERTVLGQMLGHDAYGLYIEAGLRREDFYRGVHGMCFEAIQAVQARGETPDLVTVGQEMRRRETLDAIGAAYFGMLADGVPRPTAANVAGLTTGLQELAALRLIREAAQRLTREVTENRSALADGAVAEHLATLERVLLRTPETKAHLGPIEQLAALKADIARDRKAKVWTGFPLVDEALGGCRSGEVCGLMARPGIGKTMVLGHLTRVIAENDLPHVFFSLEMPAAQIVERLARAVYSYGRYELRDRLEIQQIDEPVYHRLFASLRVVDTAGLSIADMASRLRVMQASVFRDQPIRVITIDHLGLIGGDRKMSTYDRVSTQAREIKELAKRLHATVFLAVQVNRDAGGDGSKELGLGAARDSGVVEEAMDYLIALRRLDHSLTLSTMDRERYRDVLFAKVVKNRHGMPGKEVALRLDVRNLTLTEDPTLQADQNDLARIASMSSRR